MIKKSTVIVLVNYNGFEDTKECIKSISKINGEKPFIVLVDNNSKDVDRLNKLYQIYDKISVIKNNKNIGFGRANNVGIQWAQKNIDFEYLLLLNTDTLIEPDTIDYLIQPFSKDSHIGITTGKILYEGNRKIVWYGGGKINYLRGWPRIADYNKSPSIKGANSSKYVDFISGCTMMFSKESIREIKGFDQVYFMYCEDLELSIRAKILGYKLFYESKSVIYHKVQGSTKEKSNQFTGDHQKNTNLSFLFLHMKTNQYITFNKHLSGYKKFVFRTVYWMEIIFKMTRYLFYKRYDMIPTFKDIIIKNLGKG